jgi:2-oxoglutarate ferredoxin oxidoreductase subunit alpha
MERIARKLETARGVLPKPILHNQKSANVGLIGFGSTDPAILEAIDRLSDVGLAVDYMRLRAIPFSEEVLDFIRNHDRSYVIEMNTDGQMFQLLQLQLMKMNHNNGLPLSARWITESVLAQEGK